MLYKANTLKGYKLHGLDADIGEIKEFYFDDSSWTIRYLVMDTHNWLTGIQVLISPCSLLKVNVEARTISVNLTKKQIEESPSTESDKPVSRQFEVMYNDYYGWPAYWDSPEEWAPYISLKNSELLKEAALKQHKSWDPHLRSTHDVSQHNLQAIDGTVGHVEDFIIDDETWMIRYLIIDTRNWWPGKKVVISPQWITKINWAESKVYVDQLREIIRMAPEYTDKMEFTRAYEEELHRYYNCPGYWNKEGKC